MLVSCTLLVSFNATTQKSVSLKKIETSIESVNDIYEGRYQEMTAIGAY